MRTSTRNRGFALIALMGGISRLVGMQDPGLGAGSKPLVLLAKLEVGEPGRIDLVTADRDQAAEVVVIYRELGEGEPEAAVGRLFTVTYSWSVTARSLLPLRIADGVVVPNGRVAGLFPSDDCLQYGATTTRWDARLHLKPADVAFSLTAPEKPGPRLPVPVQSLQIGDGLTAKRIVLAPEVQNLYHVAARAVDIDGDGIEEIVVAAAFYKGRAIYILGNQGQVWRQTTLPSFATYAAAEEFLKAHRGGGQRR